VITVMRNTDRQGTLSYRGTIVHEAKCWWNPDKRIKATSYEGCSATYMDKALASDKVSKRHGIFINGVVGFKGIFIHYGTNLTNLASLQQWSQGCIVLEEADVLKIWNDIQPKNGRNVTVQVMDGTETMATRRSAFAFA
jgi:hypothetical protein